MHLTVVCIAFGTAFIGLGLGWYNDATLWCWFNGYPKGCQQSYESRRDSNNDANDDVSSSSSSSTTTCERGDNTDIVRWVFFYAWLWASIFGSMVCMYLIWISVLQCEKKMYHWSIRWNKFRRSLSFARNHQPQHQHQQSMDNKNRSIQVEDVAYDDYDDDDDENKNSPITAQNALDEESEILNGTEGKVVSTNSTNDGIHLNSTSRGVPTCSIGQADHRKSNMIMWQAFRYVGAFWLTWLFGTLNRILQLAGHDVFWVMLLHSFFVPWQGFLNFLVYKYPSWRRRYYDHRKNNSSTINRSDDTDAIVQTKRRHHDNTSDLGKGMEDKEIVESSNEYAHGDTNASGGTNAIILKKVTFSATTTSGEC
jgi:hypothetical protein